MNTPVISWQWPAAIILTILVFTAAVVIAAGLGGQIPPQACTGPGTAEGMPQAKGMQAELPLMMLMIRLAGILIPPMPGRPAPGQETAEKAFGILMDSK